MASVHFSRIDSGPSVQAGRAVLMRFLLSNIIQAPFLDAGAGSVGADGSRSPVYGAQGMAATAQPLASQIALDIFKQGGSSVEGSLVPA